MVIVSATAGVVVIVSSMAGIVVIVSAMADSHQRPRAPATDGPPPRLAEAGVGPRVVEGGCQPVLAGGQSVLVDTNLLSFSLVLVLACSF